MKFVSLRTTHQFIHVPWKKTYHATECHALLTVKAEGGCAIPTFYKGLRCPNDKHDGAGRLLKLVGLISYRRRIKTITTTGCHDKEICTSDSGINRMIK